MTHRRGSAALQFRHVFARPILYAEINKIFLIILAKKFVLSVELLAHAGVGCHLHANLNSRYDVRTISNTNPQVTDCYKNEADVCIVRCLAQPSLDAQTITLVPCPSMQTLQISHTAEAPTVDEITAERGTLVSPWAYSRSCLLDIPVFHCSTITVHVLHTSGRHGTGITRRETSCRSEFCYLFVGDHPKKILRHRRGLLCP